MPEAEHLKTCYRFIQKLRERAALGGIRLPDITLRLDCSWVEDVYRGNKRFVAHTGHRGNSVCLASGFFKLNRNKMLGVLAHEVGHIMAGVDKDGPEPKADQWMRDNLGVEVSYDAGDTMEFLDEKALEELT